MQRRDSHSHLFCGLAYPQALALTRVGRGSGLGGQGGESRQGLLKLAAFSSQFGVALVYIGQGRRKLAPVYRLHNISGALPAVATQQAPHGFERGQVFLGIAAVAVGAAFDRRYETTGFVVAHLLDAYVSGLGQIYGTQIAANYHVKSSSPVRALILFGILLFTVL